MTPTATYRLPDLVVTAHLVALTRPDGAAKYLYKGTPVPDWINPDELNRHVADGLIRLAADAESDQAERPRPPAVVDMPDLVVTAPLVAVHSPAGLLAYLYEGSALPKWVNQVEYENLLSLAYVRPVDAATYAAAPKPDVAKNTRS